MRFLTRKLKILTWLAAGWVTRNEDNRVFRRLRVYNKRHKIASMWDIGAFNGDWAIAAKFCLPKASIVCFESNDAHSKSLDETGFRYVIATLGKERASRTFYQSLGTGDSLYPEVIETGVEFTRKKVLTHSLARIADTEALDVPDLIKMDIQGAELEVLIGSRDLFSKVKFLILEVSLLPTNLQAPRFQEILDVLSKEGFLPEEILGSNKVNGILHQVDVMFTNQRF